MRRYYSLLASLALSSVITSQVIAAVGKTPGQFSVSSTGSANYTIPIWTPPGPNGVQPNLALVYDSNGGDGIVGHGWSLAGMSSITRCKKTVAQDGGAAAVTLTYNDVFCLDGNRLRLTSGTYGYAGSTYQTETANFSLVTANGTYGNGPASFTVKGKNGLTYEYGVAANAAVLAGYSGSISGWMLNKVTDRAGNTMIISYRPPDSTLWGTTVPDTISWTPSSYGSTNYNYTVQFGYTANTPSSSVLAYMGGAPVVNTLILNSITVNSSGSVVRKYFIDYNQSPSTSAYRLSAVTECSDAARTNCLSPTNVGWQDGSKGVEPTPSTAISGSIGKVHSQYDLNGDGFNDLAYQNISAGTWFVAFGSTNGLATPVNTGITNSTYDVVGEFYGNGMGGILNAVSGTWYVYSWNGSSFSAVSTGIATSSIPTPTVADVNGDGRDELVTAAYQYVLTFPNTTTGSTLSFGASLSQSVIDPTNMTSSQLFRGSGSTAPSAPKKFDFNGDGRGDLTLRVHYQYCDYEAWPPGCSDYDSLVGLVSQGTYQYAVIGMNGMAGDVGVQPIIGFGDYNSDSCTDFYTAAVPDAGWRISKCDGSFEPLATGPGLSASIDWNADGLADTVAQLGNGYLTVKLSTGNDVGTSIDTTVPCNGCFVLKMDIDGDGLDDLGTLSASGINIYRHNSMSVMPDLVTSITDGFGNNFSPSYVSIALGNYTRRSDAVYPYRDYIGPEHVVKQFTASDGIGGTYTKSFEYSGAQMHQQGRGLSGFYSIHSVDSRTSLNEWQYFERAFPNTGMLLEAHLYQSNGSPLIRKVVNTPTYLTLDGAGNNQRYFPYVSGSTTQQYEVGGAKNGQLITTNSTSITYDSYGNATSVSNTVVDNDTASPNYGQTWSSTTATDISPNTTYWCLGLPTEVRVTNSAPGVPSILRTSRFSNLDYANCRETQKITEPTSGTYAVTETYGYDSFGNVNVINVTGSGMNARSSLINWGSTGQFPMSITNALNQPVNRNYNFNLGVQTSETDANGLTVSWDHDAFGRRTLETRPDNTRTTWSYNACPNSCPSPTDLKTYVQQQDRDSGNALIRDSRSFYDSFDRLRFTQEQLIDGSYVYQVHRNYDALGRVLREYVPSPSESAAYHLMAYDAVGRAVSDTLVGAATSPVTQIAYAGRFTTVTDAQNKTTTKINNVAGLMSRSYDHNGYYQNFQYDAFGSLLGVTDSLSNSLFTATYDYGIKAFQRITSDMDLGSRTNNYNALGELTSGSDAKGQSFSMTYDPLSRATSRTEAEGITYWTWGDSAANREIGQLRSVSSPGYSETHTYDSLGRPTKKRLVTDSTYDYDYAYSSSTGLLDTLTYPTSTSSYRLQLKYNYQNGMLNQVKDNSAGTTFWQANAMNARGQITQEVLGNGIIKSRAFDAGTGMLQSIQAGVGGGASVQNESYLFDLVGSLTQRQNNTQGFTENFYYDNLHRLSYSTLNGSTNLSMQYDPMGNITSKSDVAGGANWTYHPTKKHAVTQAGNASFTYTYDANGNAQTRNGYNVTWNSANYPTVINGAGKSMAFTYDANRQRIAQVYNNGSTTETTQYIGKLLEKVTVNGIIDWRHYITGGSGVVAIISRKSDGTNTPPRYILEDHQGSIARITDNAGATFVSENFTAFGERRDAATWNADCNCTDLQKMASVTRMGYTGHDMIGGASMGLIHMNGRVQDSMTGRFLSADPFIPHAGMTQSYNRYSYVMNNPMSYTDPSGFIDTDCPPGWICGTNTPLPPLPPSPVYDPYLVCHWLGIGCPNDAPSNNGDPSGGTTGGTAGDANTETLDEIEINGTQDRCVNDGQGTWFDFGDGLLRQLSNDVHSNMKYVNPGVFMADMMFGGSPFGSNDTNRGQFGAGLAPAVEVLASGGGAGAARFAGAKFGVFVESRAYGTVGPRIRDFLGLKGNPNIQLDHVWLPQSAGKWNAYANLTPTPAWLNRLMGQANNSQLGTAQQLKGILARAGFTGSLGAAAGVAGAGGYQVGKKISSSGC